MFGNRKRKLAYRMIAGVDAIKLTIYKTMETKLIDKYEVKGRDFCSKLAAAAVNEIYGCHIPDTESRYQTHRNIIEAEMSDLGKSNPDLIRPITDSLRVYIQANHMLGSSRMKDMEFVMDLFKKATDRGLFIKGGDAPKPESFLRMANEIAQRYEIGEN